MLSALRRAWPEYLAEGAGLGVIMLVAATIVATVEIPLLPVFAAWDALGRRTIEGLAIAATDVVLVYSYWGRRSGAHFNPAVTLVFLALRRVRAWDATFYVVAQIAGGLAGLMLVALLLGAVIGMPPVSWVVTRPGRAGSGTAFLGEFMSAFLLMTLVLAIGGLPRFARLTGLAAGLFVFVCVVFESPISGFSVNPARSLASAVPSGLWTAFWIYLIAPPCGMLLAALINKSAGLPRMACAKLQHDAKVRCIHCGFEPSSTTTA